MPLVCYLLAFVLALFFLGCVSSIDVEQPVVKTATATFRGKRLDIHPYQLPDEFHRSVSTFTRIPYAEPPVGQLRFAAPVGKVIEGDFDATRTTVACPQKVQNEIWNMELDLSEDCLTLDIFIPEPKPRDAAVMMWIHGGGYHMGAGSIPVGLPAPLAAYNYVIVVTINYRLGPLGFLATGDGSIPANIGLLDQRQALVWIQDNIKDFGGDPKRVTIFGESAGAGSVNLHLLSTMSAGLFSRAIMQSGALNEIWSHHTTMEEVVEMTFDMGKEVGCDVTTSTELVRCLRSKSVKEIMALYDGSPNVLAAKFFFRPVADGQFLAEDPIKMASKGSFNQVDVIIGCNGDEGSMFLLPAFLGSDEIRPPPMNRSAFREFIALNLQTDDPLTLDMTEYVYATQEQLNDPGTDFVTSAIQLAGDLAILCPAYSIADELSRAGRNVYEYLMTHVPAISAWGSKYDWLGAAHMEEIPYVFGSPFLRKPEDPSDLAGKFEGEHEVQMSLQIMKYWSNFAKYGDPNCYLPDPDRFRYSPWIKSTPSSPGYKELAPSFEMRAGKVHAQECYFLNSLVPSLIRTADEKAKLSALLEEKVRRDSDSSCADPQSCP